MVIAFNNALLRVCVTAIGRALYVIDFDDKLQCCPSRINDLLREGTYGSSRANDFNISNMELLFRDVNFRHIFTKYYVGSASFSIKKRYESYTDYFVTIRDSKFEIIKSICNRLSLIFTNDMMSEFVSKFTLQFIKDYDARILYLTNIENQNIKIKEELKKKEIELMRNVPMSNNTRSSCTDNDGSWLEAYNQRAIIKRVEDVPTFIEPTPKTPKDSQSVLSRKRKRTPETNISSITSDSLDSQIKSATNSELLSIFRSEIKRRKIFLQSNFFIQNWNLTEEGIFNNI